MVAAPEAALLSLPFPRLDQVPQTPRPVRRRLSALGAAVFSLHPQLVLPLPGNRQVRELVFNRSSHLFLFRPVSSCRRCLDQPPPLDLITVWETPPAVSWLLNTSS